MREIKFRVWDREKKEMIYKPHLGVGSGSQVIAIGLDGNITLHNAFGLPDGHNPDKLMNDRFEIMQFTGLNDKNGTEIYEGDKAKIYTDKLTNYLLPKEIIVCEIELEQGAFHAINHEYEVQFPLWQIDTSKIEIIGNIHQTS